MAGNEGLASGVAGAVSLGPETDSQMKLRAMTYTIFRIDPIACGNVGCLTYNRTFGRMNENARTSYLSISSARHDWIPVASLMNFQSLRRAILRHGGNVGNRTTAVIFSRRFAKSFSLI